MEARLEFRVKAQLVYEIEAVFYYRHIEVVKYGVECFYLFDQIGAHV